MQKYKCYGLFPIGLSIRKKIFIGFESDKLKAFWKETVTDRENSLLEALCVCICDKMFSIEEKFWDQLYRL